MSWLWIPLLWISLGLVLWTLSLGVRQKKMSPELARKAVHITLGVPVLMLPWLFDSHLQVWILLTGALVMLVAIRSRKQGVGAGLHSVARSSIGEFAYIGGVLVLWHLAKDQPPIYLASLLVLMISDAVAALVGVRYGRLKYICLSGIKSWEGSLAFLGSATLIIFTTFRLSSPNPSPQLLLLALTVALLVMMMEAVSWQGWDNLFVPVAVCILLQQYLSFSLPDLWWRFGVLLALFTLLQWRKGSSLLSDGGALAAVLAGYFCYVLGDGVLLMTVLLFFAAYVRSTRIQPSHTTRTHDLPAVLAITGPAILWALLGWLSGNSYSFEIIGIFSIQLGCTLVARPRTGPVPGNASFSALRSWALCALPTLGSYHLLHHPVPPEIFALLLLLGLLHTQLFRHWLSRNPKPVETHRWQLHALIGFSSSILIWSFQ